ncbi:putative membrane protein YccC [Streptosporangium album]|uniref:Putative membrane protein YccC n=1 Tax=Streptosporangium album TaxID=47479 RepID=A0A7W7RVA7_9ACTN|nr:FUSC family protein [Streptosporangium album]MBB4938901.1 putative membrane protein YccC [Streptosporangium album]
MRKITEALRGDFVISRRPAWGYGLLCALGICLPLLFGVVSGHVPQGAAVALGGYLTTFGDAPGLPYGERIRKLLVATLLVTLGSGLGALIQPYPWPAVAVMGLVAMASAYWPVISISSVLAVALSYFSPASMSAPAHMGVTAAGGLLMTLLLVGLWPVRRLRPLRVAFEEAGEALAGLLEAAGRDQLSDESREALRRRAVTARDDAAKAFSRYWISEEDSRALERLLATLTRIFHETVALRVLRAAAVQTDIRTEWTAELDEATGALARALREAVTTGCSTAVPAALSAMGRFTERVEEIRLSAHAGGAPLPAAVLLGQIRRCLDRIGMAVRSVAQQAAEGVEIGPRLPRFGRLRKPVFSSGPHPLRLGLAVTLAMALMLLAHEHYAKWFVVTVIVSLRPAYRDTVERVVLRATGTAVGATGAAVVLAVAPGQYYLIVFITACAALGFAFRGASYGYWTIFATPLSLMLSDFSLRLDWAAAALRVVLTIAGGALALLFARLLWPRGQRAELNGRMAEMLEEHAALVRSLADQEPDEVRARTFSAAEAADRFSDSLDQLDKEPGGSAPQRLRDAVPVARRLRDNVLALSALPPPGEESGPTATILDMVADRLENVAEAVGTERPAAPADDLDGVLDELGEHVDVLSARRLDEVAEGAADEMTGVRRGIRHAAAAQPALKGLSAEALRLASLIAPRR